MNRHKFRFRWRRYGRAWRGGESVPCNLCGRSDRVVVRTRDRYLKRLVNVMCRHCGLVFQDPMPREKEVNAYYKDRFWHWTQGAAEPTPKILARDTTGAQMRLARLVPLVKPGARLLDVGAGSGVFVASAKQAGFEVTGIEPNVDYAGYAHNKLGLNVHAAPLEDVDFSGQTFDVITCHHALEHMRDPLGALRRLHALLRPEGIMDISVPDLAEPKKSPLAFLHSGHLFGFVHETLVMMGAKAGLAPIHDQQRGTIILFNRLPAPDPDWFRFPHHSAEAEAMFRERSLLRFLFSTELYKRIPARIRRWVSARRAALAWTGQQG